METSLTIALQIILQNTSGYIKNLKIWSTVSEELNTIVKTVLDNQALTQYEYVECVDGACRTEFDIFVIGPNISSHSNDHLKPGGFILQIGTGLKLSGMQVIFQAGCGSKNITLLTPKTIRCRDYEVLKIRKNEFSWLQRLEVLLQTNSVKVVYLVSQEGDINGVVDLMRVLSTESERLSFRSIVTDSNSKVFSVDDEMYQRQLEKNVAINILRNNGWGTYIHSPLENKTKGESMSIETAGELSPIPSVITRSQAQEEVKISYLGLDSTKTNMSDSMTCSGYSGVRSSGERVMGLVASEEVSTRFEFHSVFTWTIPKSWSLQEAATVPLAYATSYYALLVRGDMKKGESILIHSAAEEVGLAAIFISLSMEAVVFASVSSSKEKEFLKKLFPKLNDENIGIVTDGKVENIIMERTKGRGVDLVLNFTADSFQPSFMCLADRGRFLQIHKEDLVFDIVVNSYIFLRNCSFQEIDMDDLFHSEDEECEIVRDLIIEGIKTGVVKPLPSTVHEVSDMKSSTGVSPYRKHEGKALLRIDHDKLDAVEVIETGTHPLPLNLDSEKSYVIIGGLGDWGLELADWLIERGATKIVLNSEVTVFNAYQGLCLRRWSRNKDVVVKVTTFHISNPKMVEDLVLEARKLGPVGGTWNIQILSYISL
nr:fatty acid synthase-like [Leptinotarsa decemlineata]